MIHDLTKWYAILLSFDALFKKLSKIYEIDLSYKSKKWLDTLGQYIDDHNNTLRQATGQIQDEDDGLLRKRRAVLQIDQSFFIDKEKIEPSKERVETYFKKLEDIFGSEFESL
jgi:hypothetical protein